MEERRHYHGGFVWPVILIGAGVVFLLNNLGMLNWDIWPALLRLWPVILIAVGLDILVGRRFPVGSLMLAIVLVGVLALAIQGTLPFATTAVSSATVERTEKVSHASEAVERAVVKLRFGSGNLNVGALPANSGQLIEGTADLSRGESLRQNYRTNGEVGTLTVETTGSWSGGPELFINEGKAWNLDLNQDLPLDLNVDAGAGKSTLDLFNLTLRRLELDGGVGQVTVKLPGSGRYDVGINGGVGQVIVIIPDGLAARISVDGGLGGVDAQGDFTRRGDEYFRGDYDNAQNRATVRVDGGVGQVVLKTLSE